MTKRAKPIVLFDPTIHPACECPLFDEWPDQIGCGDGAGECGLYAKLMGDPDAELACPKPGSQGGNKVVAPDGCPLREYEMQIVKKEKSK